MKQLLEKCWRAGVAFALPGGMICVMPAVLRAKMKAQVTVDVTVTVHGFVLGRALVSNQGLTNAFRSKRSDANSADKPFHLLRFREGRSQTNLHRRGAVKTLLTRAAIRECRRGINRASLWQLRLDFLDLLLQMLFVLTIVEQDCHQMPDR